MACACIIYTVRYLFLGAILLAGFGVTGCGGDDEGGSSSSSNGGGGNGGSGGSDVPPKCDTPADAPYVDGLTHIGRAAGNSFIEVLDVVQSHPIVYGCSSVQGLNIWDANGAGNPVELVSRVYPYTGQYGGIFSPAQFPHPHCQHVALDPDSARIAITNRGDELQPTPFIWVYDVTNPASPTSVAGWSGMTPSIDGVVFRGDRLYAAGHTAGVIVFDITGSGPGGITETARWGDAESDAWQPILHNDHLLVAEGTTGLRVYDISADTPALLTTVPIQGSSKDIVIHENIAYVAASERIAAIDVTEPAAATLIGEYETPGTALQVAIGLNKTLLVAEWEKLRGYDINDPRNIVPELSEVMPKSQPQDAFTRILTVDAAPEAERAYPGEWKGMHAYTQTPCGVGPDLEASPDSVQFGVVPNGDFDVRALVLGNNGNRPVQISNITTDSPSMTINTPQLTIEPGEAEAIEITFTPTGAAEVFATLSIDSDDLDEDPFNLRVSGNITGIDVGDPLPTFSLVDTEGMTWSNANLAGKVSVLAYFATF